MWAAIEKLALYVYFLCFFSMTMCEVIISAKLYIIRCAYISWWIHITFLEWKSNIPTVYFKSLKDVSIPHRDAYNLGRNFRAPMSPALGYPYLIPQKHFLWYQSDISKWYHLDITNFWSNGPEVNIPTPIISHMLTAGTHGCARRHKERPRLSTQFALRNRSLPAGTA